jgi:ABC-type multidrug transport system ATPase subunit
MEDQKNILESDSINLAFSGTMILNNIYLSCETGEIVGLVGRNGSGKSCLLKIIFGTLRADNQSVRINKSYFSHPYRQKAGLLYLPQDGFIPGYLSMEEVIGMFNLEKHRTELFSFKEIAENSSVRLDSLSGGVKKLMEVLTILYSDARFILLDEPFSFLSPVMIEQLIPHIEAQRKTKGIILTDHMFRTVLNCCHRLYLVRSGVLHAIKDPQELVDLGYVTEIMTE